MKIVINKCYGGFSLSDKAREILKERGLDVEAYCDVPDRADPRVVQVVEELGEASWGPCSKLKVVEMKWPPEYEIQDHDGYEKVLVHRQWYE